MAKQVESDTALRKLHSAMFHDFLFSSVLVVWSGEEGWCDWDTCGTKNVLVDTRYWYETVVVEDHL